MPVKLRGAASATTVDQLMLFVVGGWLAEDKPSNSIFGLRCVIDVCSWNKEQSELNIVRSHAVAIVIPTLQAESQDVTPECTTIS